MRRLDGDHAVYNISSTTTTSSASALDVLSSVSSPAMVTANNTSGVLLLGKLMRRDRRLFTWKWRDFVLERTRLQYFSRKGTRKGDIPLTPHTPITIRMCSEPKPFGFLLFIKDTKLTLAAATERERHQWIDIFCDVFHASVEQTLTDTKAERRSKPTYLPIPDLGDTNVDHESSSNNLLGNQTSPINILDGREARGFSTPFMAHNVLDHEKGSTMKRDSFGEDTIPILESRMTYGPIKEMYSRITFPPSLANGDLLVGVGPIVRRLGWSDERILAVGMYIDPETATKELENPNFQGRDAKSLHGDQQFYNYLLSNTTFRRSFVVTARKRVSKSVLSALLRDELGPRMGVNATALQTFLGFIEKSLKKAESMVLRIHEDDRFEYRLRGQLYPPIASHALCQCIQAIFFDSSSIQHDAKRGLVERLPSLWGGEMLDAHDEIFGHLHDQNQSIDTDDEEDSDSDEDDSGAENLFGDVGEGRERKEQDAERPHDDHERSSDDREEEQVTIKSRSNSRSKRRSVHDESKPHEEPSTKDEWAEYDDQELERLRRESCSLTVHFGPMIDRDSKVMFSGDLAADGSALLGTYTHKFIVPSAENLETASCYYSRFTVGLYVDPSAISESLLKYKGLSIGSIVQDTNFFRQFSQSKFQKHLVFKVDAKLKLRSLLQYIDAQLCSLASSFADLTQPLDSMVELWDHAYPHQQQLELYPKDETHFSISADGKLVLYVRQRGSLKSDKSQTQTSALKLATLSLSENVTVASIENSIDSTADLSGDASPSHGSNGRLNTEMELVLPPPPFYLVFESLIFGFHAFDPAARTQLMERIPNLLDLARDDLVHTYHDEIQALRENYKRQKPENRVKVGYLSISFEKRKLQRNADKGGAKEITMVPSRWSKRWCRLDGTLFSYYSHKRSRKYREMMELTRCEVMEITANSDPDVARFAWEKGEHDSIRMAIIKPNGEILALRTETIYEGEEWMESLTDATKVRRHAGSADNWPTWDKSLTKLQRQSSSAHDAEQTRVGSLEHSDRPSTDDPDAKSQGLAAASKGQDDNGMGGYDSDEDLVDKDGSLLAWVQEDPRHALIVFLLGFIVYLASFMHCNHSVVVDVE